MIALIQSLQKWRSFYLTVSDKQEEGDEILQTFPPIPPLLLI